MRRWIALLAAIAALAVTGTALAMTGTLDESADEETVTATTVEIEATTSTVEEPADPEPTAKEEVETDETDEVVWEKPDVYVPYEPGDHVAPQVEILYPEDGQVFETHEVVFEGTTEPGAAVFFGDKQADVGEDGSWRIVLDLDEGENHLTAKAIDEAGNDASDDVTVIVDIPEKPKAEEPKKEEPKEEPKAEEPKKEEPKEEEPKDDEVEWEFVAHQTYGECSENPPYDVFYGKGHPGYTIVVESPFGRQTTEVGENGEWEIKVFFEGAPVGDVFEVWIGDQHDHHQVFEFVHTD
jgi:hypothetical protein